MFLLPIQDWDKYVDLVTKATTKRHAPPPAKPMPARPDQQDLEASSVPSHAALPLRKGRGPRKEETKEDLLRRLLDPTLTLEEAARILEVCPTTVRRYTNRGILPHERSAGNQRRFKLSHILEFREAQGRGKVLNQKEFAPTERPEQK